VIKVDMETIKQVEKICKLDIDKTALVMLEFSEAYSKIINRFSEDSYEVEKYIEKLGVSGVFDFGSKILEYLGFKNTDDAVGDIIETYLDSNCENRMDTLKKELIEIILETEGDDITMV
jgi:hypothetical protein